MATRTFARGLSLIGESPLGHFSFFSFFRGASTPDDKSAHRQTVVGSSERRCYPIPSPRKFTSSRFTSSAWVQVMQCGPSFTTNKRAPLISLAVRSPEAVIGKIRSASPWITSVGTSIRVRSLRKSSYHVGTQARLAVAEARAAMFQLDWTACSLTRRRQSLRFLPSDCQYRSWLRFRDSYRQARLCPQGSTIPELSSNTK